MSSEDSCPSAKRQRTVAPPITRSEIWYDDGSVVLRAHSTQFRIHWTILSSSSFFRDMRGLPQPPDQASVEGCPLIELSDSVQDVEHLLNALYQPLFFNRTDLPFPVIASLVRLGRKYDFTDLLEAAMERLMFEIPSSLDEYQAREQARVLAKRPYTMTRITPYPGVVFDVIELARQNNMLRLLPCACYRVAFYRDRSVIFDGRPRGDGTFANLAPLDQRTCLLGRDRLLKAQYESGYTFGWLRIPGHHSRRAGCTDSAKCHGRMNVALRNLLLTAELHALSSDTALRSTVESWDLCSACGALAQDEINAGRQKIWESLPTFFDLPVWNELKNDL